MVRDIIINGLEERAEFLLNVYVQEPSFVVFMLKKLLLTVLVSLWAMPAFAQGFITELGGGVLSPNSSYLTLPDCKKAVVTIPMQENYSTYSCGGDYPIFFGWPIAWEFKNGNTKIGWAHFSHWFDGNGELHFNCLCVSHRFEWGKRK